VGVAVSGNYSAEQFYRDVKLCTIGENARKIQRW